MTLVFLVDESFQPIGAGMVLSEEKRNRLAEVIACHQGIVDGAGASAPSALLLLSRFLLSLPRPRLLQSPLRRIKGWWRLTWRTRTLGGHHLQ